MMILELQSIACSTRVYNGLNDDQSSMTSLMFAQDIRTTFAISEFIGLGLDIYNLLQKFQLLS